MEYLVGQIRLDVFLVWVAIYRILRIIERHTDYHVPASASSVIKYTLCSLDRHVFYDITEDDQVVSVIPEVVSVALPDASVFILEPVLPDVRCPYFDRVHCQIVPEQVMPLAITRTHIEAGAARSEMLINIIHDLYLAIIV